MAVLSLRKILTIQPVVSLLLSLAFVALFSIFWVHPQIRSEVESRQSQLARAVGSQLEQYLETSMTIVRGSASIHIDQGMSTHNFQHFLDAQLRSSNTLNSIVVADYKGHTFAAGILQGKEQHRLDLLNIDVSRNSLYKKAIVNKKPYWSETFLSVMTGELSVAYAVPGKEMVVIGEVKLESLSSFLQQIVSGGDLQIMVIDNKGQVIADHDNQFTGQQFNVSNIPLVQKALQDDLPVTGRFEFQRREMIGSMLQVSLMGWHVLVAQPVSSVHKSILKKAMIIIFGLSAALLAGVVLSIVMARKLSTAFNNLNELARDIADGKPIDVMKETYISEFNMLSDNLLQMSDVLILRERELTESEAKLRLILDSTGEAVYGIDLLGHCTFCNSACLKVLGYQRSEDLLGKDMHRMIHHTYADGSPIPVDDCRIFQAFRQGEGTHADDEVLWRADGVSFAAEYRSYPQFRDGKPIGAVVTFTDITGQKQLKEQLQQSQKMESIGTLAGGIAHDFNNILYPLIGFAEMLQEDLPQDSQDQESVTEILHAALRAKDLVKQILAFSRQSEQTLKPVRLQLILNEALKLLKSSIPKTIDIQVNINPDCGMVVADPTQIHQIIMNLATNAYHAMQESGGQLKVSLDQVEIDTKLLIGKYALLKVLDTGTGINKEAMDKIFDPYFTTKELGKGTGLGLSVVQGIVKSCHGDIQVYSEPGKGTEIHIYMPIMKKITKIDDPDPSQPILGGKERILLVDDEEMIVKMEKQMLERLDYQVTIGIGSVEALNLFKENPDTFDLIVSDMTMPDMTGLQLAGKIKSIRNDIPIIICTGFSDQINEKTFKKLGIQGYVMKPVIKREIAKTIRDVLNENYGTGK